jgi:flagellar motor switch protein FliN
VTTETPVSVDPQTAQLQKIWVDCFQAVLGQVAGFPVTVEASGEEEPAPRDPAPQVAADEKPPVCMVISASKALQGDMAILAPEAGALALAQILVSDQLNAAVPFDNDRRDAYEELVRQVLGQVATSLKKAAGGEVEVKPSGSDIPSWSGASRAGIKISAEKLQPILLSLLVSPELAKSLQPRPETKEPPAQKTQAAPAVPAAMPAPPKPEPPPPAPPPQAEPAPGRGSNMELLLEVKLDASIRFGQKRMLLRDILELHPGTAVALDRQVQDPVELLVGGQVVAQGEVVIVDGNYGLRITEILSPMQRIDSLGKQR